jgi:prophage maintenance system killer protein
MIKLSEILPKDIKTISITRDDIVNWNKQLSQKYGEQFNILQGDPSSALHRADYYDDPIDKISAIFHSLSQNHIFNAANKRTALTTLLHYFINVDFEDDFLENLVMDTVNQNLSVEEISNRIKNELPNTTQLFENINIRYNKLFNKLFNQ